MPVRKIPKNYRFPTGLVALGDGDYAEFEGTLERDNIALYRFDIRVSRIEAQPVSIPFQMGSKTHLYTPDLLVEFSPEYGLAPELIEVKPRALLRAKMAEYRPKFRAASALCREKHWKFRVRHEGHIRTPYLEAVEQLTPHLQRPIDEPRRQALIKVLRGSGPRPLQALLDHLCPTPAARLQWLPAIWACIAQKQVKADITRPIGPTTLLEAWE